MKLRNPKALVLLATFIFLFSVVSGQNDKKELLGVAKQIIDNAGTCALITIDNTGSPRARAMDPFPVEEDFTIWFGTNSNSRKVDQIKNDPRVTLYYLDNDASGYVVISGEATLIDDNELKSKYWKESWKDFYPENRENYLLIKVTPLWLEVLSPPNNVFNDTYTWEPPVVKFESD